MKANVCRVCAITGILCPSCSKKYAHGVLTDLDIRVAKEMYLLEEKRSEIGKMEMVKAYNVKTRSGREAIVVIVRYPSLLDAHFLRSLSKSLSSKLKKPVKIVQDLGEFRKTVSQLVHPARVVSVSTVWLPDGTTEYDVFISRKDLNRMFIDVDSIKRVAKNLTGRYVRFTFI